MNYSAAIAETKKWHFYQRYADVRVHSVEGGTASLNRSGRARGGCSGMGSCLKPKLIEWECRVFVCCAFPPLSCYCTPTPLPEVETGSRHPFELPHTADRLRLPLANLLRFSSFVCSYGSVSINQRAVATRQVGPRDDRFARCALACRAIVVLFKARASAELVFLLSERLRGSD